MLPDEVRKAVERLDQTGYGMNRAWQTIKAHLLAREAEVANLRAETSCTLGVGRGDGNLFVHGDFDSIKAAQDFIFRAEKAEMLLRDLRVGPEVPLLDGMLERKKPSLLGRIFG